MDPDGLLFSLRTGLGDLIAEVGVLPFMLTAVALAAGGALTLSTLIALVQRRVVRARPIRRADGSLVWEGLPGAATILPRIEIPGFGGASRPPVPRIGFSPTRAFVQTAGLVYPVVTMPQPGSLAKRAELGRSRSHVLLEDRLGRLLERHFGDGFTVHSDRRLAGPPGQPYFEPALLLSHRDEALRLHIAIEIDEPYAAGGEVRHALGPDGLHGDRQRDRQMAARGWVVVRFAEEQVVRDAAGCCRHLAEVVRAITPGYALPSSLEAARPVGPLPCWDAQEAALWARQRHRERYLGLQQLWAAPEREPDLVTAATVEDAAIEASVRIEHPLLEGAPLVVARPAPPPPARALEASSFAVRPVALLPSAEDVAGAVAHAVPSMGDGAWTTPALPPPQRPHGRDDRIHEAGGELIVEGEAYTHVRAFVREHFPPLDFSRRAAAILASRACQEDPRHPCFGMEEGEVAARLAAAHAENARREAALRQAIARVLRATEPEHDAPEMRQFARFLQAHPSLSPQRADWHVFDESLHLAGTVDALLKQRDGELVLVLWTRARGFSRAHPSERGLEPLGHLPNANVWHLALEANLLRHILRRAYDIDVAALRAVAFHGDLPAYEQCELPDLPSETEALAAALRPMAWA